MNAVNTVYVFFFFVVKNKDNLEFVSVHLSIMMYLFTSLQQREQFVVEDLQSVFEPDSLGTSHPVRVPVNSPDEINEIFDSISYSKVN